MSYRGVEVGLRSRVRTCDPKSPRLVRYRAALYEDKKPRDLVLARAECRLVWCSYQVSILGFYITNVV